MRVPAVVLGLFVALAGCSSTPTVEIKTTAPARIFIRPTHDAAGTELPADAPFTALGEAPIEWEVPQNLLGGRMYVRAVFETGDRDAYVQLPQTNDSEPKKVRLEPPKGLTR